ncbi:MAG TPA: glycosyltransferase 87 family protein [Streptosporangiaceae bacterium]|nr:glycosyltransferase 87 family protein [Streptosporangiaceae bacterium]
MAGICAALAVLSLMVLMVVRPDLNGYRIRPLPYLIVAWLAFGVASWLVRKVPVRIATGLILAGGAAIQAVAVSAPPQNSTDMYRYIWDGEVQAAGIDPYAYVPAARQLTFLRGHFLWHHLAQYCVSALQLQRNTMIVHGCTQINRPTVPTIYPPVAEAYFHAAHFLPYETTSTTSIQAAAAGLAMLTTVVLLFGLRRLGRNVRLAALWAWCPTVALEAGNNAHVDVLAVALAAVAMVYLATGTSTRRLVTGGLLLGLAIGTKVTPALVLPAVLRRQRWLLVAASTGSALALVYVPHLLSVGGKVIGFIPGYLREEGYDSGNRFGLIGLLITGKAATFAAVLLLALMAFAVFWYAKPDQPWRGAVVMTGSALAITTPHYQWYALLLVMLVALDGRPEWLAFAAGAYYVADAQMGRYTPPYGFIAAIAYGVPLVVVLAVSAIRFFRQQALPAPAVTAPAVAEPAVATAAVTTAALAGPTVNAAPGAPQAVAPPTVAQPAFAQAPPPLPRRIPASR